MNKRILEKSHSIANTQIAMRVSTRHEQTHTGEEDAGSDPRQLHAGSKS